MDVTQIPRDPGRGRTQGSTHGMEDSGIGKLVGQITRSRRMLEHEEGRGQR